MEIREVGFKVRHVVVVVSAHDRALQLVAHNVDALGGRSVVPDHVADRYKMRRALVAGIRQDRLEGVYVGVDVSQYGVYSAQGRVSFPTQFFKTTAAAIWRSSTVVIFRFGVFVS